MEECPFCGAECFNSDPEGVHFACGTCATINDSTRQPDCYKRQLAQQIALLREVLEVVEWAAVYSTNPKAQALATDLRAAADNLPKPSVKNLHREI